MVSLRRWWTDLVARVDRIADRDADPAALTGRSGQRRHGLALIVDPPAERTPEEAQQALDELRADQHRRMRGHRPPADGD